MKLENERAADLRRRREAVRLDLKDDLGGKIISGVRRSASLGVGCGSGSTATGSGNRG